MAARMSGMHISNDFVAHRAENFSRVEVSYQMVMSLSSKKYMKSVEMLM